MSFYSGMRGTANRLITKFGQPVTISRKVSGAYNPDTGTSVITSSPQNGRGLVEEYSSREVDGTNIIRGDKRLLLSSVGISRPQINDSLTASGVTYVIKDVVEVNPGGTALTYVCNIRA